MKALAVGLRIQLHYNVLTKDQTVYSNIHYSEFSMIIFSFIEEIIGISSRT